MVSGWLVVFASMATVQYGMEIWDVFLFNLLIHYYLGGGGGGNCLLLFCFVVVLLLDF